jgi:D-lactate dehydrogenase (cytochrome)
MITRVAGWRPLSSLSTHGLILGLRDLIPSDVEFSQNSYELGRHGRGESYHPTKKPDAVISPTCVDDIVTIVKYCSEHRIPIVPFGAGTSVEGHVCCLNGGISLDMKKFQSIEIPDMNDEVLPDAIATVGAGVTRNTLNNALRHTGLQFVVDPGADATIGGMVATGASGTTAVRYGTMRENILAAECVLADGTIVNTGTKALKNSAGYDLLGLLCGSEGTLGVITKVTVKLHAIPEHLMAAVCVFDTLEEAAQAVATLKLCDIPVLRCELLDEMSVVAFNAQKKEGPDREEKPTLFLEFQAPSNESLEEQVKMTESICDDFGGSGFVYCSDEDERKALWSARHSLYYASINLRPGSTGAILTDACVPLSKFAEVIRDTANEIEEKGVVGPCFGHAGDGNFHCILPTAEEDSEEYLSKLHEISNNIVQRTLKAGGTCTGEHGIGYGKIKYLEQQYGPGAVHMIKLVKQSIDPKNIMNPGKVVPRQDDVT